MTVINADSSTYLDLYSFGGEVLFAQNQMVVDFSAQRLKYRPPEPTGVHAGPSVFYTRYLSSLWGIDTDGGMGPQFRAKYQEVTGSPLIQAQMVTVMTVAMTPSGLIYHIGEEHRQKVSPAATPDRLICFPDAGLKGGRLILKPGGEAFIAETLADFKAVSLPLYAIDSGTTCGEHIAYWQAECERRQIELITISIDGANLAWELRAMIAAMPGPVMVVGPHPYTL